MKLTRMFLFNVLRVFNILILRGRLKSTTYFVAITQTSFQHTSVTANPLDERRGEARCRRGVFSIYRPEAYFSVRRREATRKATKPIAKGLAVTSTPPFGLSLNASYLALFKRPLSMFDVLRKALNACVFSTCVFMGAFVMGASSKKLVLTGSSTVAPLMLEIAKAYEKEHPKVRIDVQTGGSFRGIADARSGAADIGMISRSLKKTESDIQGYKVATDGIGLIVHRDNLIQNLNSSSIKKIFKGEITNWKEVGGPNAPISVVNKAEGRSTLEVFLKHFKMRNREIKADVIIGDNEQGVKTVAGNPHAIGYVSIGVAEYDIRLGVSIKLVALDGIQASVENVKNQTFPLRRELNLVTAQHPPSLTRDFIQFAQSEKMRRLVLEQAFTR